MKLSAPVRIALSAFSTVFVTLLLSACGGEKAAPAPSPVGAGSVGAITRTPSGPTDPTPIPPPSPVPPPVIPIPPGGLRMPDDGEGPDDSDNFFVRQTLRIVRVIGKPRP